MSDVFDNASASSAPARNRSEAFVAATHDEAIRTLQQHCALPVEYLEGLRTHVAPLAAAIAHHARVTPRPILVGLNGCQGSGKSTLARFLALMLGIGAKLRCAIVSIDDFYLEKSARQQLARDVHPLLLTRGVPGTHDLSLGNAILDQLLDPKRDWAVKVPVFDKARDDRASPESWPAVLPGINLVLLEGWCVGCPPQNLAALHSPINELEADDDAESVWRTYVNDALTAGYKELFARLDLLVMLAAPGFDSVFEWRLKQESQLAQRLRDDGKQSAEASALLSGESLRRFVRHYERLTRHQLDALPEIADGVIALGNDHRMTAHSGRLFA